jgi:type I restriction enzyme M protein
MSIYGQEKDNATWALCKMNMVLHNNEIADIRKGNSHTNPQFTKHGQLETFDFAFDRLDELFDLVKAQDEYR